MPRSESPEARRRSPLRHRDAHHDRDRSEKHRIRGRDSDGDRHYARRHRHRNDSEEGEAQRRRTERKRSQSAAAIGSEGEQEEEHRRQRRGEKERSRRESSRERAERKRRHKERSSRYDDIDDDEEAERRAKAAETLLYATETDPTQAGAASQTFKWAKKADRERKMGITPAEARRRDEERRREAEEEIKRLNQKRAEREREQVIREEEEARMARMAESAAMAEWVAKEDDFYLEQSRKRAVIRIREDRAKPIDLLAINLKWVNPPTSDNDANGRSGDGAPSGVRAHPADELADDDDEADLEIDLEEPFLLFDNLHLKETEELHEDIQMYLKLEKNEQNLDFWRAMIVVCDDKLADLRAAAGEVTHEAGIRSRIDPSVKADMDAMLSSKTHAQLLGLQEQVRQKLRSGEPVDVEYWEGLLKAIIVWRAKAKLRDMHEVIISNRLEHLRQRQRIEQERRARLGLPSLEEERAAKAAEAARRRAERESQKQMEDSSADLYAQEAAKALEEDEEVFASRDEDISAVQQGAGTYSWEDKYRPRKPRYFNKVLTGYEWNKYNQTHYDTDNPPPKQVQGYKFNIFYPDLIDKSKPPTYRIIKEKGNDETCLIIFEAGPPYETIGFRIVNKPWNMSHQRGFRAVFERGVLQLHCE